MASMGVGNGDGHGDSRRSKTNQLLQNFFTKAAMVIIQTRIEVPPSYVPSQPGVKRVNKWFNIELDDTDLFASELHLWRVLDAFNPRTSPPPPLIVETYLDASDLTPNQTLVILDDNGRRWKVESALAQAGITSDRTRSGRSEVILERWKVTLGPTLNGEPFTGELPVVYKKSIVLFRTLYTYLMLMPVWKLIKRIQKLNQHGGRSALKICVRVRNGDGLDDMDRRALETPLVPGEVHVTEPFNFGMVDCPVGTMGVEVRFRKNCEFRVDDSESLLSSHFINEDELFFAPSLPNASIHSRQGNEAPLRLISAASAGRDNGSLPSRTGTPSSRPPTQGHGTYGSHANQPSSVPLARNTSSDRRMHIRTQSPLSGSPMETPHSLRGSRASLRSESASVGRRPSISINPFKTPSLSNSPATNSDPLRSAGNRMSTGSSIPSAGAAARTRQSTAVPPAHRQSLPPEPTLPLQPSSASPRPNSVRYSSSFKDRKRYIPPNREGDDQSSSGKGSYASSAAQWPAGYPEEVASSSPFFQDEKNLHDLIALLESKPTLKSFEPRSAESSTGTTANSLSKFQRLKDSHAALSDSIISSSSILQKPSSSQSSSTRNLSNPLHASGSSSSPGGQLSPHTPHAPLVRSRLSEGLTVDHEGRHHYHRPRKNGKPTEEEEDDEDAGQGEKAGVVATGTSPLDIPTSPRLVSDFTRRPGSLDQRHVFIEDDSVSYGAAAYEPSGRQSVSLGSVDIVPMSLQRLAQLQTSSPATSSSGGGGGGAGATKPGDDHAGAAYRTSRPSPGHHGAPLIRPRGGSNSSATSAFGMRGDGGPRSSNPFLLGGGEDELLFAMSEDYMGRDSLDEKRGKVGGQAGRK